jgi:hypothetical protein
VAGGREHLSDAATHLSGTDDEYAQA